jgi:hypothetical protein
MIRTLAWIALVGCSTHEAAVAPDASPDTADMPGVIAVPLAGCSWSFTGTFSVGGDPFSLTVDTGSSLLAVASTTCAACSTDGVATLYDPSATAVDQKRSFTEKYDGGDMQWTGEEYRDTVAIGGTSTPLTLFAITTEQNFFFPGQCGSPDGILGMQGSSSGSLPATLATAGIADVFAMHECRSTGMLWLGGYDSSAAAGPPEYVAMPNDYTIGLTDIAIGGASIGLPTSTYGQAIVDSGGPAIIVPQSAYSALTTAIAANPTFAAAFGDATWFAKGSCAAPAVTKAQLDAQLPPLGLSFGATSVALAATDSYLMTIEDGATTYYCPALATVPSFLDLGNSLIRSHLVIFDRDHRQLGLAPALPCP